MGMPATENGWILKWTVLLRAKRLLESRLILIFWLRSAIDGVVGRRVKLSLPQKYHLDISNIQHHQKAVLSAMLVS